MGPECVEAHLGEAIAARCVTINHPQIGMGPPDLCVLEKVREKSGVSSLFSLSDPEHFGYFHWVLGLDPSLENIASYFMQVSGWWFGVFCPPLVDVLSHQFPPHAAPPPISCYIGKDGMGTLHRRQCGLCMGLSVAMRHSRRLMFAWRFRFPARLERTA